jgi:hypothetical protein
MASSKILLSLQNNGASMRMLWRLKCNIKISHKWYGFWKAVLVTYFNHIQMQTEENHDKPVRRQDSKQTHARYISNTNLVYYCIINLFIAVHL